MRTTSPATDRASAMIARVLTAACFAGFLAAGLVAVLQAFATTPLIVAAESFEQRAAPAAAGAAVPAPDHDAWKPSEGLPRAAFTALATLVSGVGYALLLAALLLAAGSELGVRETLSWAIGAFVAVNLAPAIGLPPELPGTGGEHLAERQLWWLATVLATGAGLFLIAALRAPWAAAAGLAAIVLPHLVGAPHGAAAASDVPAALAARFAARSLAIAFVFWIVLGLALGWAWRRLAPPAAAELARARP